MATLRASRLRLSAGVAGVLGAGALAATFVLTAATAADLERAPGFAAIVIGAPVVALAGAWWQRSAPLLGLGVVLLAATWAVPRLDEPLSVAHVLAGTGMFVVAELVGHAIASRVAAAVEARAAGRWAGAVVAVASLAAGLSAGVGGLVGGVRTGPGWLLAGLAVAVLSVPAVVWLRTARTG